MILIMPLLIFITHYYLSMIQLVYCNYYSLYIYIL